MPVVMTSKSGYIYVVREERGRMKWAMEAKSNPARGQFMQFGHFKRPVRSHNPKRTAIGGKRPALGKGESHLGLNRPSKIPVEIRVPLNATHEVAGP